MWEVAGGLSLPPAEMVQGATNCVGRRWFRGDRPGLGAFPVPGWYAFWTGRGRRRENGKLYLPSGFEDGGLSFLQHRGVMKLMNKMNAKRMTNAATPDQ